MPGAQRIKFDIKSTANARPATNTHKKASNRRATPFIPNLSFLRFMIHLLFRGFGF